MSRRKLSVGALVTGLYVCELDRPWTDTPFLFQGFLIETEADIEALRAYCQEVWVDAERSHVMPPDDRTATPGAESAKRRTDTVISPGMLKTGIHRGLDCREFVRRCITDSFARMKARSGSRLSDKLVEAASRLDGLTSDHPEVAHWLANLQAHDQRLVDHSLNVAMRSLLFARYLGLPQAQVAAVGLGALLHDVGKLGLPVSLLNKQGPLRHEEWGQIRRHPALGQQLLSGSALPETVMRIIRYHHERIDGSGFPEGLKGDELDIPIRVVALVNAFDSMTSSRGDRSRLSGYQAVSELMRDADRTWGRQLVESFVRCVGIYPAGTRVRLTNDAEGVVVYTPAGHRLHPVVCLYRRPDGSSETRLPLLNLSQVGTAGRQHHVKQVIEPDGGEQDLYRLITDQAFAV